MVHGCWSDIQVRTSTLIWCLENNPVQLLAIENMDGAITHDKFVKVATESSFTFTDEAKCSKCFCGPLKY